MDAAFEQVSEVVVTCDVLNQAFLTGLAPLAERVQAAHELADGLDPERVDPASAAVTALTTRIDDLSRACATDPLSLAGRPAAEVLAALDTEITAVSARLAGLASVRDGWDNQLAELAATLREIDTLRRQEEQARQRAQELIADPGLAARFEAYRANIRNAAPRMRTGECQQIAAQPTRDSEAVGAATSPIVTGSAASDPTAPEGLRTRLPVSSTSMSTPAGPDDGFEVVVGDDGTLTVPAAELARHGVRPGTHLRLVPEQRHSRPKRLIGALKDTVPAAAVEQFIRGLDESKAERAAHYSEATRQA